MLRDKGCSVRADSPLICCHLGARLLGECYAKQLGERKHITLEKRWLLLGSAICLSICERR